MGFRHLWDLLKETVREWLADQAPSLAAGLAYYTLFAVGPITVVAISVAGLIFGRDAARGEMIAQIRELIGPESAEVVSGLIVEASDPGTGWMATITGLATLLFGATGAFNALQSALNHIWEVQPDHSRKGVWKLVRSRFLSLAMVLAIGFLLLVSLVVSAVLAAVYRYSTTLVGGLDEFWQVLNFFAAFGIITVLFATIFKYLPDAEIEWRDVWIGALVTSLLFNVGKTAIGLYLGNSQTSSAFGAAGSLVVLMLWVYYSAQLVFFGAEFTQVYARRHGSWIGATPGEKAKEFAVPEPKAVWREQAQRHRPETPTVAQVATTALGFFAGGVLIALRTLRGSRER